MLGKTSDDEFKLLRIRELDNDDVDGKPDSDDTPPNGVIPLSRLSPSRFHGADFQ